MSILKKPYEISVWEDEWDSNNNKFVEKRIAIIGTDQMLAQCRALEPNLSRNVNGVKKFSFKMYKKYIDSITGEETTNPFTEYLISERKVKLKYDTYIDEQGEEQDRWYDFIIKDVSENSTNYLCTYQLEDALVQELSKNGFNVVLDEKVRDNDGLSNMGTAEQLAEKVLAETNWNVDSEVFVEKIKENLVYVTVPEDGIVATQIIDQTTLSEGISLVPNQTITGAILAFYSSCTGKPHRFQFIKLNNYDSGIEIDDEQIIENVNCQYFYEVNEPEEDYTETNSFYLPNGWSLLTGLPGGDSQISNKYRGARIGFAQDAEYVSVVDRYCNKYVKNGENLFGFVNNNYVSPQLVQNVITSADFKSTSGWTGSYTSGNDNDRTNSAVKTEVVSGMFLSEEGANDKTFTSIIDDLYNGNYETENNYIPYLKIHLPQNANSKGSVLINSGFYDNRTVIKSFSPKEKWRFEFKILYGNTGNGYTTDPSTNRPVGTSFNIEKVFDIKLCEVNYNSATDKYSIINTFAEVAKVAGVQVYNFDSNTGITSGYLEFVDEKISEKDFKNKEIKLVIAAKEGGSYTNSEGYDYYLEKAELYKEVLKDETDSSKGFFKPGEIDEKGIIKKEYKFFSQNLENITAEEQIVFDTQNKVDYSIYKPVYNDNGNKVRAVSEKESNYFNILQSIAETFEAWLSLEIKRNSVGGITEKWVKFKNYAGNENHAYFRYSVNLKDITRTFASKNIVSKLIVKQNANKYGENEFCTIQRAEANPTGENCIYDFRYYHEQELMDVDDYLQNNYYLDEAQGPDIFGIDSKYEDFTSPKTSFYTINDENDEYNTAALTFVKELQNGVLYTLALDFDWWGLPTLSDDWQAGMIIEGVDGDWPSQDKTNIIVFDSTRGHKSCFIKVAGNKIKECSGFRFKEVRRKKEGEVWTEWGTSRTEGEAWGQGYPRFHDIPINGMCFSNLSIKVIETTKVTEVDDLTTFKVEFPEEEMNEKGYFPRLKKINDALKPINEEIIGLETDLIKLRAEKEVEEGLKEAAETSLEELRGDFIEYTGGIAPENISTSKYTYFSGVFPSKDSTEEGELGINVLNPSKPWAQWAGLHTEHVTTSPYFEYKIWLQPKIGTNEEIEVYESGDEKIYNSASGVFTKTTDTSKLAGLQIDIENGYEQYKFYRLKYTVTSLVNLQNIGGHCGEFKECSLLVSFYDKEGYWKSQKFLSEAEEGHTDRVIKINNGDVPEGGYIEVQHYGICNATGAHLYIQPNRGIEATAMECIITNIEVSCSELSSTERTIKFQPIYRIGGTYQNPKIVQHPILTATIPANSYITTYEHTIELVDTSENTKARSMLEEYATYQSQISTSNKKLNGYNDGLTDIPGILSSIATKEDKLEALKDRQSTLLGYKQSLNQLFYAKYSRFIQEGTWIDEKYHDDNKYYLDALSVMYNSCYPQVAYSINVLELSKLPGYEFFKYELGDRTYVVDPDFFGTEGREKIIISEIAENLDDPTKNTIKVQNFKNQFQDLFQKITATVQQAQYSTGSYEKAAELATASERQKAVYFTDSLAQMGESFSLAGTDIEWKNGWGIILTDRDTQNKLRLTGGVIMMYSEDANGQKVWKTGITPNGISASMVTTGTLNTGEVNIMNGNDHTFRWDRYGLSAYRASIYAGQISKHDPSSFVRFDQYGIYGIANGGLDDEKIVDGDNWYPDSNNPYVDIDKKATFALTYEGLKVTGNNQTVARIGVQDNGIIKVTNANGKDTFVVDGDGNTFMKGEIVAETGDIGSWKILDGMLYSPDTSSTDGVGMAPKSGSSMAFWAGFNNTTTLTADNPFTYNQKRNQQEEPNQYATVTDLTQFYVLGNGSVYCKDLHATGGKIGGWYIEQSDDKGCLQYISKDSSEKSSTVTLAGYGYGGVDGLLIESNISERARKSVYDAGMISFFATNAAEPHLAIIPDRIVFSQATGLNIDNSRAWTGVALQNLTNGGQVILSGNSGNSILFRSNLVGLSSSKPNYSYEISASYSEGENTISFYGDHGKGSNVSQLQFIQKQEDEDKRWGTILRFINHGWISVYCKNNDEGQWGYYDFDIKSILQHIFTGYTF